MVKRRRLSILLAAATVARRVAGVCASGRTPRSSSSSTASRSPSSTSSSAASFMASCEPQAADPPGSHRRADRREAQDRQGQGLRIRSRPMPRSTAPSTTWRARMGHRSAQFSQVLERAGVSASALKARIKAELTWQQMVRGQVQRIAAGRRKRHRAGAALARRGRQGRGRLSTIRSVRSWSSCPAGRSETVIEAKRREAENLRSRFPSCDEGLPLARARARRRGARADHPQLRRPAAATARRCSAAWRSAG